MLALRQEIWLAILPVILPMRKTMTRASLVGPALAIFITVAACAGILALLAPWPDGSGPDSQLSAHSVTALSARPEATERQPKALVSVTKTEFGDGVSAAGVQLAKRDVVPLPVRQEAAPAPDQTEVVSEVAATTEEPLATAAMPRMEGRLSKSDGDAALAPLLSYAVSDADIEALKEFVKLVGRAEFSRARPFLETMRDPVARKFARWYYYRAEAPDTTAAEIGVFLNDNPLWPNRAKLQASVEDALFWRETDPKKVLSFFADNQPISGTGKAALGGALISVGRKDEGEALVREAWRRHVLTSAIEKRIRKLHVLAPEDHRARADYLLMQDDKSRLAAVKRLLPLIEGHWRASAKARIAVVERSKKAGALLTQLDKEVKNDPAVLLARIQWLRRKGEDKQVWSLLRSAPKSPEKLVDPTAWWTARDSQIRLALNSGNAKTAYALAKEHNGELEDESLSDSEFLAGWIALRFLDQPGEARKHFLASAQAGGLPKRRSRAGYWLGRAELALKNERAATARFAEAAQHSHTFYGQLAHQMIAAADAKAALRNFVRPTEREIAGFVARDVMKAIVIAEKAGFDNLMTEFLFDLAREIDSAPEMILLCELSLRTAPAHRALRMAKIAMNRSFPVEHYAYPNALPQFKAVGGGSAVEMALLHALTRQESEFNPVTVSSAGALGLMQLLPSTAKEVARSHDVKFEKNKLTSDPAYNVSLGTAFLQGLMRNYDGSYVMALAGYNAGPGRVRQWVGQFGDPRNKTVDPIDWIERIPFTETREYVHKILESAQVYRSRLAREDATLRLAEDLHRGRKDKPRFMLGATN